MSQQQQQQWLSRRQMQCFEIEKLKPSYDNPQGIKIHCEHWPCYYPSKKLKIRLIFNNYERLIYYDKNGTLLMSLRPLNTKKYLYTNPFCSYCRDITMYLRRSYLHKGKFRSKEELTAEIERLNDEARDRIQELKQQKLNDNDEIIIYDYNNNKTSFINVTRDVVCDSDEFSESIGGGNLVYEYGVRYIQGWVNVITEKEEFDTSPFKYLKEWTYTETVNPDKYVFWSKLKLTEDTINDKTTCAICIGELLLVSNKEIGMVVNKGYRYECDSDCSGCFDIVKSFREHYLRKVEESVESIVRLPCKHMFHEPCVLQWIYQNPVCPLCRISIPSEIDIIASSFNRLPYVSLQGF